MPTRKLPEPQDQSWGIYQRQMMCQHPDHNPPNMMVFEPGSYEHICPGCDRRLLFVVPRRSFL